MAGAPPNREVRRVQVADYPYALRDHPVVQRTWHPAGHCCTRRRRFSLPAGQVRSRRVPGRGSTVPASRPCGSCTADRHRELLNDLHVLRDLVRRQLAVGELADRRYSQRCCAVTHLDPGAELIAVLRIGNSDPCALDVRVGVQEFLDLGVISLVGRARSKVKSEAIAVLG